MGACANDSVCQRGTVCVNAICQPTCAEAKNCANGPYGDCVSVVDGNQKTIEGSRFCSRSCHPESPTLIDSTHQGCVGAQRCRADTANPGVTTCVPGGPTGLGGSCTKGDECQASLLCIANKCVRYCRIGTATCGTKVCTSNAQRLYDGPNEVGYCPL